MSRKELRDHMDRMVYELRERGPVFLLESQSTGHPAGRYSYLAGVPLATIKAYGDRIIITEKGKADQTFRSNPWQALSEFYRDRKKWVLGYLGYDLKNSLEQLCSKNPDPVQAPDLYFMVPGTLIRIDNRTGETEALYGSLPEQAGKQRDKTYRVGELKGNVEADRYKDLIKKAQQRIFEGAFYEVNLSHQLQGNFEGDPYGLYRKMRSAGPVPFGAFASFGEFTVCCQSPERFLCRKGDRIFSQPIKGTIGRGEDAMEDRRLIEQLKQSAKDQAENLMIVDLVRNDLGRIARKGSVKVSELFEIQTFGTVHQMVSTITAESAAEDPVEILGACYPMGSMTGAPKISAMKGIEELETYRRGIYSGAIGYIDPRGDFDFNVVIRTAIIKDKRLFYAVGGAITGDSDPAEEWEETLVKARALTSVM